MRILHVSSLWPPVVLGGAEIYAARLAEAQRDAGHEVGAVTFGVAGADVIDHAPAWPYRPETNATQPEWKRLIFHALDLYNPRAAGHVRDAVARFDPDIVHTHSLLGLSTAALLAAAGGRAGHVHTVHDYWLFCRRTTLVKASGAPCSELCAACRVVHTTRRLVVSRRPPDLVIAPTKGIAERHRELPWAGERVRLLPHPIPRPAQPRRRPWPGPGAPVTFGFAGQVTEPKGVRTLLQAFAQLPPDHRLVVAGRGPLVSLVEAAGDQVEARGWLDADGMDRFYEDIDCLVIPSEWPENAPLVVLEARGRGLPVVGARTGGIPEIVDPASATLLFPPGDVDALATALSRFAADPAAYRPAEPAGSSWSDHLAALADLYEEAIHRHRSRTAPAVADPPR